MRTAHSSSLVGVYLSAWWDPPWVWVWRPPWVWAWRPSKCWPGDPQARPLIFVLGCAPGDPPGAGLETPRCGPGDISKCQTPQLPPLGVGLETPPGQTPQLCPPFGVGLQTCKACWDTNPPLETCKASWDTTCNACWDTTPVVNRMTGMCKNINLPQTLFACGKNWPERLYGCFSAFSFVIVTAVVSKHTSLMAVAATGIIMKRGITSVCATTSCVKQE